MYCRMPTSSIDTPDVRNLVTFKPLNGIVELTIKIAHPSSSAEYLNLEHEDSILNSTPL